MYKQIVIYNTMKNYSETYRNTLKMQEQNFVKRHTTTSVLFYWSLRVILSHVKELYTWYEGVNTGRLGITLKAGCISYFPEMAIWWLSGGELGI